MNLQGMTIAQLRALRDNPRFSLPRITPLRRLDLSIDCEDTDWENFQSAELFDSHLAVLGAILCAVKYIEVSFGNRNTFSATLSEQLVVKMKEHFPTARICRGYYWTFSHLPE